MSRLLRLGWALPAAASSGLVALLPDDVRPSPFAWIAGTAVVAGAVCLATRRRTWLIGTAALATSLGLLVQLRLGEPAGRLGVLATAAGAVALAGVVVGRSARVRRWCADAGAVRVAALAMMGAAVVLRVLTVLGPSPAAGTLPLVGVQIGELTRYLMVVGSALAIADPLRGGPRSVADRRFTVAATALGAVGLLVLAAVGDLGPAVLVAGAMVAAAVHVGGLDRRRVVLGAAVVVALAPLAWTLPVLRTRVGDVVDPGPQVRGALTAAWSGGLIGPGPGRSPLVDGVPAISSDYAVAALVADLGALVVVPVLLVLLGALLHLLKTAAASGGPRATVAVALATVLAAQSAWNALGAVAVLPLTGLNQPFLGVSGASLLTSALALGLALGLVEAPGTGPAPGGPPLATLARVTQPAVATLLVAAAVLLVLAPRPLGDAEQLRMPRGTIWTADGQVIATDESGRRVYPAGGRYADLGFERRNDTHRGVEAVEADVLTCGGDLGPADLAASLFHPVCRTADVVTTIDSDTQGALVDALGALGPGATGEGVLLDAPTGAVLALSSSTSTAPDAGSAARTATGPPGSTMKLVTAAAALMAGVDLTGAPAGVLVGDDGSRLANSGGATCPGTGAATALAHSCNSVYGWAATQVGADDLAYVARTWFGADRPFLLDGLDVEGLTTGPVPPSAGALARTGIGQESVRSSVMGMALATAVVANGGSTTPWPHLVAASCPGADPVPVSPAAAVGPPLPAHVADVVHEGMREAVTEGTARRLVPHGHPAAAKTGTAQLADGGVDQWITAIVDERRVLTLVVHHAAHEGAAVDVASWVLAALPPSRAVPSPATPICPTRDQESTP